MHAGINSDLVRYSAHSHPWPPGIYPELIRRAVHRPKADRKRCIGLLHIWYCVNA